MLIDVVLMTALAGFASFAGAVLACFESLLPGWLERDIRHGIIAFGGGALLAAVALVLVPQGMALQPPWLGIGGFILGAAIFMAIDRYFQQHGSAVSQLLAMMLDFVPEAVALGALITGHYREAIFLAVIIGAQNIPEGFNAYREMTHSSRGMTQRHVLWVIAASAATGPLWGLLGLVFLAPDSILLGGLMTFCSGGILYLVFCTWYSRISHRRRTSSTTGILPLGLCSDSSSAWRATCLREDSRRWHDNYIRRCLRAYWAMR